jgi:hypothetical protein
MNLLAAPTRLLRYGGSGLAVRGTASDFSPSISSAARPGWRAVGRPRAQARHRLIFAISLLLRPRLGRGDFGQAQADRNHGKKGESRELEKIKLII